MRTTHSEYSVFTYLTIKSGENWVKCANNLIKKMEKKNYKYDVSEFGDWRKECRDIYANGNSGAPMCFFKRVKKLI